MATEREYLASLTPPLAKLGRGKFSAEAHAALDEARKQGVTFDQPSYLKAKAQPAKVVATPATVAAVTSAPKAPRVTVAPETVKPSPLPENSPVDKGELKRAGRAWARLGDQIVGYRTCFARDCRKSVVDCACDGGPMPPIGYARVTEREAFAR